MAIRRSLATTVIRRNPEWDGVHGFHVGHPCGPIAPSYYLKKRPKMSRNVAHFLLGDTEIDVHQSDGAFECMLWDMWTEGLSVPRKVIRRLKHWRSAGCPTWYNSPALSACLQHLWDTKHLYTPAELRAYKDECWKLAYAARNGEGYSEF